MLLKTKPIVTLKAGDFVRHPNGVQANDITKKDLEANPEKYVNLYPHLYANAEALQYELGLLAKQTKKGKTRSVNQRASKNGQVYPVIVPVNGKVPSKSDSAKDELNAYMRLIASKKTKVESSESEEETTKKTGRGKNK